LRFLVAARGRRLAVAVPFFLLALVVVAIAIASPQSLFEQQPMLPHPQDPTIVQAPLPVRYSHAIREN
jgi:hypothetical protein